jgi:hypothetical protein
VGSEIVLASRQAARRLFLYGHLRRRTFLPKARGTAAGVQMIFGIDGDVYRNGLNVRQFVTMFEVGTS